jgi:hypothetical protein
MKNDIKGGQIKKMGNELYMRERGKITKVHLTSRRIFN